MQCEEGYENGLNCSCDFQWRGDALFPGDMFIGLGFGLGPESDEERPEMSIEDGVILKLIDRIQELEVKVEALAVGDRQPVLFAGLEELENKVETLTRTLDIWQEMLGIEVVAVPTVPVFDVKVWKECDVCQMVKQVNTLGVCTSCHEKACNNNE